MSELPAAFVERVGDAIAPGATVLVTDEPITPATSGPRIDVINSEPPEADEPGAPPLD